jgi:quercetin dioxygenase-like cupin family protein
MRRIGVIVAASIALILGAGTVLAQHGGHVVSTPDTLKWVEPPTFPGARLAIVQGDPAKEGLFVYRVKLPANYRIAPHTHKASENVTVLSGVFFIGMGEKFDQGSGKELPVGGFVSVPAQHPHFAWAGKEETLVQVHGVGPTDITFVNPADDPRKKP